MSQIDTLLTDLLRKEGGYVAHPADRGGPTNYGITLAVARAHGFTGSMQTLPLTTAMAIYRADYWTTPHFDQVEVYAPKVAAEMFDTGVNAGVAVAVMILQRALNVLQGTNLKVDGVLSIGGATLGTLRDYMAARGKNGGERVLLTLLNCFQGVRYAEIVERNPSQRAFIFGWLNARVAVA